MKIAVEGCAHGELEKIYDTIQNIEKEENVKVDLLLCCGDFQATRNLEDLQTMAVPKKYQDICTFYKYYSGEKVAPILTIFIGGNHEASNYMQELPYGGWVAPNIYYLGYAGVILVNGIRIGGLSGIYKGHDFLRGHHEFSPYTESTKKSVYHVRQLEVFRLKQLSGKIDIFMSHDWPRGIYNYGNKAQLVRFKPHFKDEIDSEQLGSRPCEELLKLLKPSYWFSAHMHCKFAAIVSHENEDEPSHEQEDKNNLSSKSNESVTKFLALDKCLPKRRFLQLLDIDSAEHTDEGVVKFEYDLEWLTILYLTNHLINVKSSTQYMPGPNGGYNSGRYNFRPTEEEMENIRKKFGNELRIQDNFCRTVEAYNPNDSRQTNPQQPKSQINPQSMQFCDTLCIDDPLSLAMLISGHELSHSSTLDGSDANNSSLLSNLDTSACETSVSSQQTPLKRKSSLGLNLPKPMTNPPQSSPPPLENIGKDASKNTDEENITESIENEPCEKNDHNVVEEDTLNEKPKVTLQSSQDALNSKPPIKKFKRRNQTMYKDEEDD